MNSTKNQPLIQWSSTQPLINPQPTRSYRAITVLFGWVPFSGGMKLRNFIYQALFAQIGKALQIEPGVNFIRPYLIKLGNKVNICSGTSLEVCGEQAQLSVGDRVRLDRGVNIKAHDQGHIEIGDRTYIGPYTCLSGRHIKIGNDCMIASHSGIYANNHVFSDPNRKINQQGHSYQQIVIEDDCWLGTGVRLVDGVTIGQGSVIGAGAVVTKSIPPYSVAVGVPARVLYRRKPVDPPTPEELNGVVAIAATTPTLTDSE